METNDKTMVTKEKKVSQRKKGYLRENKCTKGKTMVTKEKLR